MHTTNHSPITVASMINPNAMAVPTIPTISHVVFAFTAKTVSVSLNHAPLPLQLLSLPAPIKSPKPSEPFLSTIPRICNHTSFVSSAVAAAAAAAVLLISVEVEVSKGDLLLLPVVMGIAVMRAGWWSEMAANGRHRWWLSA